MPRHKRLELAGCIYHVIQRGIERREIFKDDADRKEFLRRFEEALTKTGSKCYGWALMSNHFHLLVRTGTKPLSDLMRKVLSGYATYFNVRHKRRGFLYQNRYKSILCQEDVYLLELVRYIHLNPLRARIVKDIAGLNRYKWSGHSVLIGKNDADFQSTGEILDRFGDTKSRAMSNYLRFVEEAKDTGKRRELTGGGLRRSAGGAWSDVVALRAVNEYWRGDERVLGDGDFVNQVLKISDEEMERKTRLKQEGWDIGKLVIKVCEQLHIDPKELSKKGRSNTISKAKSIIAYLATKELGAKGSDIAKIFHITKQAISKMKVQGEILSHDFSIKLSS